MHFSDFNQKSVNLGMIKALPTDKVSKKWNVPLIHIFGREATHVDYFYFVLSISTRKGKSIIGDLLKIKMTKGLGKANI